jgi:hypothetical protein
VGHFDNGSKVVEASSYREMGADTSLKNGLATNYGLGVSVNSTGGRRTLSHGGEVLRLHGPKRRLS